MRFRDKAYLDWVRRQPCARCNGESCGGPSEAHHLKHVGHMSGAGLKAPDWTAMPLCPVCHRLTHAEPDLWPLQWQWLAETLGRAFDEGVLVVDETAAQDVFGGVL